MVTAKRGGREVTLVTRKLFTVVICEKPSHVLLARGDERHDLTRFLQRFPGTQHLEDGDLVEVSIVRRGR